MDFRRALQLSFFVQNPNFQICSWDQNIFLIRGPCDCRNSFQRHLRDARTRTRRNSRSYTWSSIAFWLGEIQCDLYNLRLQFHFLCWHNTHQWISSRTSKSNGQTWGQVSSLGITWNSKCSVTVVPDSSSKSLVMQFQHIVETKVNICTWNASMLRSANRPKEQIVLHSYFARPVLPCHEGPLEMTATTSTTTSRRQW